MGLLLSCLGLWALPACGLDVYGRRPLAAGERYELIVVLGCRVRPDGRPSEALAERTRLAVALYEAGHAPRILFTGGVGEHPPSEADAAGALAARLGVPARDIQLERSSTSTEENARFAARVVAASRVLVVSDAYHVFRGERVFGRYFAEVRGVGSVAHPWPRARGALREVAAVLGYAVTGRL